MTGALLRRSWWVVFPGFVLLVGRFSFERACADPYSLMAAAMSRPLAAWPIALLYVAAHVWMIAAYLQVAGLTDDVWPARSAWRSAWSRDLWKVGLMTAALAVEYCPVSLWKMLGAAMPSLCGG